MKKNMTKRLLAALMAAALAFSLAACGGDGKTADGGGSGTSDTAPTALTEDEYVAAFQKMGESLTGVQDKVNSGEVDLTDPDTAKATLEEMKDPFNEFSGVTPPEKYAEGHDKLKAGCADMVSYLDDLIGMVGETDQTKVTEAATTMQEHITSAMTNFTEGATLLDAADKE